MQVTFLGLGKMGRAMAGHVLTGGHDLTVWNRSPGKAGQLVDKGAQEATVGRGRRSQRGRDRDHAFRRRVSKPCAAGSYRRGPAGHLGDRLHHDRRGRRQGVRSQRDAGRACGTSMRPSSAASRPATDGTLGIVAGGSEEDLAAALPLLQLWGDPDRIRRVGDVGSGNALKSVINLTLGVAMGGIAEALRLAHDLALDRHVVLDVLEIGPLGFSAKQKRKMLESGEFDAATFTLDAMIKDLDLALNSAHEELPVTARDEIDRGRGVDGRSRRGRLLLVRRLFLRGRPAELDLMRDDPRLGVQVHAGRPRHAGHDLVGEREQVRRPPAAAVDQGQRVLSGDADRAVAVPSAEAAGLHQPGGADLDPSPTRRPANAVAYGRAAR